MNVLILVCYSIMFYRALLMSLVYKSLALLIRDKVWEYIVFTALVKFITSIVIEAIWACRMQKP
jgi:hypothetical protein